MENLQKTIVWSASRFYLCLYKNTHQAATSLETIQVLVLISQKYALRMVSVHGIICRYNWIADYTVYNHACPQNHVNSQNKQGALGQSECW